MKNWRTKDQQVVTEQVAEQLADEAEAGYELTPQKRGRPSLTGPGELSPQITFRLDAETRAAAQKRAETEHTSVSALARIALERYLAS